MSTWWRDRAHGKCHHRLNERASTYLVLLLLAALVARPALAHKLYGVAVSLMVVGTVITVESWTRRLCPPHVVILGVLAHALPFALCLHLTNAHLAWDRLAWTAGLLLPVLLAYRASRTWPYVLPPTTVLALGVATTAVAATR